MKRPDPFGKTHSRESLVALCEHWKSQGERVVFTNGVFDLLHAGHVIYLQEARALGTKLIVALNTDASAKRLNKGPARPLNDESARMTVLSALSSVDAVTAFDEDTPTELIAQLVPNVLVKGGDYSVEQIAGADVVIENGGEVRSLAFVEGYSTSAIEQKILRSG